MRLKVGEKRMLVFAVRGKRKMGSIITPQKGNYSDYFQLQNLWVAEIGPECVTAKQGVEIGSKVCILDVYDMEELPLNVFESYYSKTPEMFQAVVDEAERHGGYITSEVIHENNLIGLVED